MEKTGDTRERSAARCRIISGLRSGSAPPTELRDVARAKTVLPCRLLTVLGFSRSWWTCGTTWRWLPSGNPPWLKVVWAGSACHRAAMAGRARYSLGARAPRIRARPRKTFTLPPGKWVRARQRVKVMRRAAFAAAHRRAEERLRAMNRRRAAMDTTAERADEVFIVDGIPGRRANWSAAPLEP